MIIRILAVVAALFYTDVAAAQGQMTMSVRIIYVVELKKMMGNMEVHIADMIGEIDRPDGPDFDTIGQSVKKLKEDIFYIDKTDEAVLYRGEVENLTKIIDSLESKATTRDRRIKTDILGLKQYCFRCHETHRFSVSPENYALKGPAVSKSRMIQIGMLKEEIENEAGQKEPDWVKIETAVDRMEESFLKIRTLPGNEKYTNHFDEFSEIVKDLKEKSGKKKKSVQRVAGRLDTACLDCHSRHRSSGTE
ncbi:MAG: hypothetical protein HY541_02520 [Deltaproteobacteria bacterium]|nr:hypothetical protein [Deltaproteobacteria bacterium]